jgi:hypothetical protein
MCFEKSEGRWMNEYVIDRMGDGLRGMIYEKSAGYR